MFPGALSPRVLQKPGARMGPGPINEFHGWHYRPRPAGAASPVWGIGAKFPGFRRIGRAPRYSSVFRGFSRFFAVFHRLNGAACQPPSVTPMGGGPGGPPTARRRHDAHLPIAPLPIAPCLTTSKGTGVQSGGTEALKRGIGNPQYSAIFCESRSVPSATPTLSQGRDRPGNVAILRVSILASGTENWYGGEVGDDPMSGRPRGRVPNQGVPEPLNPVDGFPGAVGPWSASKGATPLRPRSFTL